MWYAWTKDKQQGCRGEMWDARATHKQHCCQAWHAGCKRLQDRINLPRQLTRWRHHKSSHLRKPAAYSYTILLLCTMHGMCNV